MNEIKVNSQICTTIEQSQRLLDLGLKPETADMVLIKELAYDEVAHCTYDADTYMIRPIEYLEGEEHRGHTPAWSLHRLIEILDSPLIEFNVLYYNPYEEIIYNISECIKNGYISKEYLKR